MIPSDPKLIEKMKELAARNDANGDWGDEVTIIGIPGGEIPMTPEERTGQVAVTNIVAESGDQRIPKRK